MNVQEEASRFSSEQGSFLENEIAHRFDPVDFFIVTRVPVETYRFKWILNQFNNISNNEELYSCLYSPYYKLKLTKYENGFGLFHICQKRHEERTVNDPTNSFFFGNVPENNTSPFAFRTVAINKPLRAEEKDNSREGPCQHIIEYQVAVADELGRERTKWNTCFSNKISSECCRIGEFRSNSWKTFFTDVLVLNCCVKVTKTPKTEKQYLDTERSLESHCWESLSQDLKSMYKNSFNADCTLEVGTENIRVNSSILAARSSAFKKMFDPDKKEQIPCSLTITDVPLSAMKRLVEFLYTGAMEEATKDIPLQEMYDLYYAADRYEVMDLRKMCGITLMSKASVDNASKILMLADKHCDNDLKSQVFNFIRLNFETVLDSDVWRYFMENKTKLANEALIFCAQKFKAGVEK